MKNILKNGLFLVFLLFSSCATINNKGSVPRTSYEEIREIIQSMNPYDSKDRLSEYLKGSGYIQVRYYVKRRVNWGSLIIYSPIRASANLYINEYRYRRRISDPREILYLLNYMQSFLESETESVDVVKIRNR